MEDKFQCPSENVVKKIISTVLSRSAIRGYAVSDELAIYTLKVTLVNPDHNFNVDNVQTKDEVDKIIEACVDRLCNRTPALDTIKMQVFFNLNYATKEEFMGEHDQVITSRLKSVMKVLLAQQPRTKEELHDVYHQIVSGIVTWSGLGSSSDISLVKATTTALQSVFPQPELGNYFALNSENRERQLEELRYIVTGINLYNWKYGKGVHGIENVPSLLQHIHDQLGRTCHEELIACQTTAFRATAILEQLNNNELEVNDRILIWEASVNARQAMVYLTTVKDDITNSVRDVKILQKELQEKTTTLHSTVQAHVAIPTGHVYPLFIQLTYIWKKMQNEKMLMTLLQNVVKNLSTYTEGSRLLMTGDLFEQIAHKLKIKSDEDRLKEIMSVSKETIPLEAIGSVTFKSLNFIRSAKSKKLLAYQGFCCWSLINQQMLLPGNSDYIMVDYRKKLYTFVSMKAAKMFAEKPEWYTNQVLLMAKSRPDLIQLLQVHDLIYPERKHAQARMPTKHDNVAKSDVSLQTELHPVQQNIVVDYEWNEWKMRKKALELTNLRKKVTHSSQTIESHLRRENYSQVYLPKNVECQTVKTTESNTVSEGHFLSGLRGYRYGKPGKFKYLDLSEPN